MERNHFCRLWRARTRDGNARRVNSEIRDRLQDSQIVSAPFRDARLKIDRAKKHIAEFTAAHIALENSCTSTIQDRPDGGQSLVHEIPELRTAMDELALIAGDAIHNLRSALDFGWRSTLERCLPDKVSNYNSLPVRDTREEVHNALHGIDVDTRCVPLYDCIMSEVQPYKGGRHNSAIWGLHDFDISDKHLLLLGLDPVGHINGMSIRNPDGGLTVTRASLAARHFDGRFIFDPDLGFRIENKGQLSVGVTLQETGIFELVPVEQFLSTLNNFTLYTVQLLEKI
jgi:hypothetical protein